LEKGVCRGQDNPRAGGKLNKQKSVDRDGFREKGAQKRIKRNSSTKTKKATTGGCTWGGDERPQTL